MRWRVPPPALPKRPFRDSAILYGALSIVIVVVTALTGGDVAKGAVIAVLFFFAATSWSWWRFRERLARESRER
jgi:hypothetical protein